MFCINSRYLHRWINNKIKWVVEMNELEQSQRLAEWLRSKGIEVNNSEELLLTQNVLVLMDCAERLGMAFYLDAYTTPIVSVVTPPERIKQIQIVHEYTNHNWQPAMCFAIVEAMFKMMESE